MKTRFRQPPKKGQLQKIGIILEEVLSQKGYLTQCKELSIVHQWPSIVDPAFAAVTRCEKLEKNTLFVKVKTAPWRQEAAYRKESIIAKIKTEFGYPTIKDIVFY